LIYIFGEVLFDEFPDGSRVLGGAPFNVAWHLQAFGESPCLVSRVGTDKQGAAVRAAMEDWGLSTSHLQTDLDRPTGRVTVAFNAGEPAYDIVPDCAYDHIETVPFSHCELLYHGSLAARATQSATTLQRLRSSAPDTVFIDVNLRPPWWQPVPLQQYLAGADWVKLNTEELAQLAGAPASPSCARDFLERLGLQGLLVTQGAKGAQLLLPGGESLSVAPAQDIDVVDTVGAGDAFAAVMLLALIRSWPMPVALRRAQQFAAAIVAHRGATVSDREFYRRFTAHWALAD
jgi:fructokinase